MAWIRGMTVLLLSALGVFGVTKLTAGDLPSADGAYAVDNARAMDRMMHAMAVKPSGDVDRDFVAMMVAHHQGAIDMALAQLRHGRDETLRRMAQEIIVEQQQEIVAMQLAAKKLPGNPSSAPSLTDLCTTNRFNPFIKDTSVSGAPL